MRVVVIYRPNSSHGRVVEDFARDFVHQNRERKIDLQNVDTRDGAAMASLYDVTRYPAVLALTDDGQLVQMWQGENLPQTNELAYYSTSV